MASQKKIVEMIAAIKTIFSYYAKDSNVEMLVKTWHLLLRDYPDEVVEGAFLAALKKCKVPPTPADIIEIITEAEKSGEMSDQELWAAYHKALNDVLKLIPQFQYTYIDSTGISQGEQARRKVTAIWDGLPPKIRDYVASKSELIARARELNYGDISFEKNRFFKALPVIEKRITHSTLFLDGGENRLRIE